LTDLRAGRFLRQFCDPTAKLNAAMQRRNAMPPKKSKKPGAKQKKLRARSLAKVKSLAPIPAPAGPLPVPYPNIG
jgi:hypothetical protein